MIICCDSSDCDMLAQIQLKRTFGNICIVETFCESETTSLYLHIMVLLHYTLSLFLRWGVRQGVGQGVID